MHAARYALPLLVLTLAPTLALAQLPDSLLLAEGGNGLTCPAYGADFGVRVHDEVGPYVLKGTDPLDACEPLANLTDINGRIAFTSSGGCAYTDKVQHAIAAGAVAVAVYNDDPSAPYTLIVMEGDCPPEVCSVPAVSVSYWCGDTMLTEPVFREPFTLIPIRTSPPVAVEAVIPEVDFALGAAYPNPTSAQTSFVLDLPIAQTIRAIVYDVRGREVAVLHDGPLAAGSHRFALDAARLPSGLYLVRATGEGYRATRKLVVTRGL